MKRLFAITLLLFAAQTSRAQTSYWNSDVRSWAVDPRSADFITNIGPTTRFWPDWGTGYHGIPYTVVTGPSPTPARVDFRQDFYSDPSPYPLPPNAAIQGADRVFDDRHCLVVVGQYLYELALARRPTELTPYWTASYGARFDMASGFPSRPFGWSSTDAAGLPVYPGLVKYDEAASGNIDHAIRITVRSCNDFIWPATHGVTVNLQPNSIPMGAWFRLKASVNPAAISSNPLVQTIIRALQVHGVIVADYGGPWYAIGAPDDRWGPIPLNDLKKLTAGQFEAVREPQYVQHNPVRPIVCGTVTDRLLNPVAGAMVSATGPISVGGWTDATGSFMLAGLPQGDYSVSITSNSFQNFSKFVHIDPGTVQSLQYRLTPKISHTISGRVVDGSGSPMVGFYVQTGRYRVLSRTDGTFFIQGLSDGVYQVHCEDLDFSVSADQTVTVTGADVKGVNFTATRTGYDISVTLKLADGTAVKSAVVKLVRPGTTDLLDYDISDLAGAASFRGAKSSYLIVPSKGGFKFTPAFVQIAVPANLSVPVKAAFVGLKTVAVTP